jgi:hypothetical protein
LKIAIVGLFKPHTAVFAFGSQHCGFAHGLEKSEIPSHHQRALRACKHILIRSCRRTSVAAIAGMASETMLRGTTAANRIPNRLGNKGKREGPF